MTTQIFRAVVESVEPIPNTKGGPSDKRIFVIPWLYDDEQGQYLNRIEVAPPSMMPTSVTGGGTVSSPSPGQHCIVAYDKDELIGQILTYCMPPGISPFGEYAPENLAPGATVLKVGGVRSATLKLAPDGQIKLGSDPNFSSIDIDGVAHEVSVASKIFKLSYNGGILVNGYEKENHITGITDITYHQSTYAQSLERRLSSDRKNIETEDLPRLPHDEPYVGKAIIRAGSIFAHGLKGDKAIRTHPYQIETRQTTVTDWSKDTVTQFRLGYQDSHYDMNEVPRSGGALIEWLAKRNDPTPGVGVYSSYVMRYGKQSENSDYEKAKGEVFRHQIYEAVVNTIGTPLTDPLGRDKGYELKFNNINATEAYVLSFGQLSEPEEADLKDSYFRQFIHSYPGLTAATVSAPSGNSFKQYYGGKADGVDSYFYSKILNKQNGQEKYSLVESYTSKDDGTYSLIRKSEPLVSESLIMKKGTILLDATPSATKQYKLTLGDENSVVLEFKDSTKSGSITFSNDGIIIESKEGPKSSQLIMKNGSVYLKPGYIGSPAAAGSESVTLGSDSGGQELVTKSWLNMVFANHFHASGGPGSPTSPPMALPTIIIQGTGTSADNITKITKAV